jgi:hypothetical protein
VSALRPGVATSVTAAGVVALAACLLGLAVVFAGFTSDTPTSAPMPAASGRGSSPSLTGPATNPSPSRTAEPPAHHHEGRAGLEDLVTGPVLPPAAPVSIQIPRLRIASPLETLAVDSEGTMEVPDVPAYAGWYRLGPAPGMLGPAVIAGHVTWNRVPAVFFDLSTLRPGDVVEVARSDGRIAVFRVSRVAHYAKSAFPTQAVFGPIDHAGLRLITCGGPYDSTAHWYADNVVVFARLSSSRPTTHADDPPSQQQ